MYVTILQVRFCSTPCLRRRLVHGRKFGGEKDEVGHRCVRLEFAGKGAVLEGGEQHFQAYRSMPEYSGTLHLRRDNIAVFALLLD